MQIDNYQAVISACRFCFMCRHLSPAGNVTFREADTPRGRALICDRIRMDNGSLKNPDHIATLYDADLSAACRFHCVSKYDETGLVLAARRDIAEAGLAPGNVKALAETLGKFKLKTEGSGKVLYCEDAHSAESCPEIGLAFLKLAGKCKVLRGGDAGKALRVLGFHDGAGEQAAAYAEAILGSGCGTVVTSSPALYHALTKEIKIDGVRILHSAEYLLSLKLKGAAGKQAYFLESDYLRNYCESSGASRSLLKSLGYEPADFGTNNEESYSAGEGAVVLDRLNPGLEKKLCARIVELADNPESDLLIAAAPATKHALKKFNSKLNVISIEEAALSAAER